jgi:hypothetical protein
MHNKIAAYGLIGLCIYQSTVTALISHFSWDARLLRDQLEILAPNETAWKTYNRGRPAAEQHHSTVYVPSTTGLGRGEDISTDEARARLDTLDERVRMLKDYSLWHRIGLME